MDKILYQLYNKFGYLDKRLQNLTNKTKVYILGLCSLGLFLIILKLNIMTPIIVDDFFYSLTFDGNKINSIKDIFLSQYQHYLHWGGRSVVHFIAQLLLIAPPLIADVLNSLVFVLFIVVIYFHAKGCSKDHSISLFILIFISQWFIQPAFAETVLWLTGSANYLFGMFIILTFMLPYRLFNNKGERKYAVVKSAALFLFGIISGWTNENVSVALVAMILLFLLYWRTLSYRIPAWAIFGCLGCILGCCILLLAPGNSVRAETLNTNHSLFAYYYKFNIHTGNFMHYLGYLNIITAVLLILILKFSTLHRKLFLGIVLIYAIGIFISLYSMLLSPTFPGRAWFGIISFNIVVFALIYFKLNDSLKFIRCIKYSISSIAVISFCFNFYVAYKEIKASNIEYKEREELIKQAIKENKEVVLIESIHSNSKFVMGDSPFIAGVMSNYYGIKIEMK